MHFAIDRAQIIRAVIVLCTIFSTALLLSRSAFAGARESTDAKLSSVRDLMQHQQYDEALSILSNVVARQPDATEAVALRGVCYSRLEEFDRAVRDFATYFKTAKEPVSLVYHRQYGLSLVQCGEVREALAQFDLDVKREPKVWDYRFDRTQAYMALHQYDKALSEANILIPLKPDSFRYALRAQVYWQLDDYQKSLLDWSEAIKRAPHRRDYYEERARCYDKLGKPGIAASDRKKRDSDFIE